MSNSQRIFNPSFVFVDPTRFTIVARSISGFPRQFFVTKGVFSVSQKKFEFIEGRRSFGTYYGNSTAAIRQDITLRLRRAFAVR